VMTQRTHLFNTTIRENIAIARDGADETAVIEAAQRARVHDFIARLPQGYATFAGEGGLSLSGGERQRIALARILLKDAPLTVLDEATANLDAVTERAVLESIYETLGDRSLLLITHRLTLLDRAHEIIVLQQGRIVERGTHQQLVEANGLYTRLWDAQRRLLHSDIQVP
ncbi:MAG: ATP-binding cassette domain-containing protein, partial [Phototrophicaceae bacterium]